MSRLQKKCLVASTAMHGLLLVVVLVGPAFLLSDARKPDLPVLKVIPGRLVDEMLFGGGSPSAKTPPAPELPKPSVQPVPEVEQPKPLPPAEPASKPIVTAPKVQKKPVKPAPEPALSAVLPKDPPPSPTVAKTTPSIKVDTKFTARTPKDVLEAKAKAAEEEAKAEARAQAAARRRVAEQLDARLDGTLRSLKDLSSSTTIEIPGRGGEAFANYGQAVISIYERSWIKPAGVEETQVAGAAVTIARSGKVISAILTRPSGNPSVDKSIQDVLNRVRFIAPFPEGSKDDTRMFNVNFELNPNRLTG